MTTKELATFTAELSFEKLPAPTIRKTKQCILDWLGVCIRGSQEQPIKIIRDVLLQSGGKEQANVLAGNGEKTSAL